MSSRFQLWELHFGSLIVFLFVISIRFNFNYWGRNQVMLSYHLEYHLLYKTKIIPLSSYLLNKNEFVSLNQRKTCIIKTIKCC